MLVLEGRLWIILERLKRHLNQKKWHNQRLEVKTAKSSPGGDNKLGSGENLEMAIVGDERSTGHCEPLDGGAT